MTLQLHFQHKMIFFKLFRWKNIRCSLSKIMHDCWFYIDHQCLYVVLWCMLVKHNSWNECMIQSVVFVVPNGSEKEEKKTDIIVLRVDVSSLCSTIFSWGCWALRRTGVWTSSEVWGARVQIQANLTSQWLIKTWTNLLTTLNLIDMMAYSFW